MVQRREVGLSAFENPQEDHTAEKESLIKESDSVCSEQPRDSKSDTTSCHFSE